MKRPCITALRWLPDARTSNRTSTKDLWLLATIAAALIPDGRRLDCCASDPQLLNLVAREPPLALWSLAAPFTG